MRNYRIYNAFIAFLKKHKAVDKYLKAVKAEIARPISQRWICFGDYEDISEFYDTEEPNDWILHGFTWKNTKEKSQYWSDLHDLWKAKLSNFKPSRKARII